MHILYWLGILRCPLMDRLNAGSSVDSPLSRWAETYGLCDAWQWKYLQECCFICQSSTYASLSHIDLIYVSNYLLAQVLDVSILPHGISDHAPMLLQLRTDNTFSPGL